MALSSSAIQVRTAATNSVGKCAADTALLNTLGFHEPLQNDKKILSTVRNMKIVGAELYELDLPLSGLTKKRFLSETIKKLSS